MTPAEFEKLGEFTNHRISVEELHSKRDRTLMYGYTLDRQTFHVYLKDGLIHIHVYQGGYALTTINNQYKEQPVEVIHAESGERFQTWELVPTKRAYPERCDYEFCRLLINKGKDISFTTWTDLPEEMQNRKFHGRLIGEDCLEQK